MEHDVSTFLEALREQRWDDHRYYHHSRINQSLHLVSAFGFLAAYTMLFFDPALGALLAWGLSMTTRQAGHFFFEPKGYDHQNDASHEHKESIKVGYNLRRKVFLHVLWIALPVAVLVDPTLGGLLPESVVSQGFWRTVGVLWLALGVAGVVFRAAQLAVTQEPMVGLVWVTKILTDPFHDIKLYWRAPLHLARGELVDPRHAQHAR